MLLPDAVFSSNSISNTAALLSLKKDDELLLFFSMVLACAD